MKNAFFFLLVTPFLFVKTVVAQLPGYEKLFTAPGYETVHSLIRTLDGGLVHLGATTSFGSGLKDIYAMKMDAAENVQWIRSYGGPMEEFGSQIQQYPDSGYLITGYTKSFGSGGMDGFLLRTDKFGNPLWQRTIGGAQDDVLSRSLILDDLTVVSVGFTRSKGAGDADFLIVKFNSAGDTLWTKILGGPAFDGLVTVNIADGGLIFSGRSASFNGIYFDGVLFKTDSSGNTIWQKFFGGTGWDEAMYVKQTFDKGFITTGSSNSFLGGGSNDVFTVKTDSAGNILWARMYGGHNTDASYELIENPDSGYTIVGYTESFNSFTPDRVAGNAPAVGGDSANFFIIRIDMNGDTIWSRAVGGNLFDEGYTLVPWDSGGCITSGFSYSFSGSDTTDLYYFHLDRNGETGCHNRFVSPVVTAPPIFDSTFSLAETAGLFVSTSNVGLSFYAFSFEDPCAGVGMEQNDMEMESIKVFPNPFANSFQLQFPENWSNKNLFSELKISNALGKIILYKKIVLNQNTEIIFESKEPGICFLEIRTGENTIRKKLMLIR